MELIVKISIEIWIKKQTNKKQDEGNEKKQHWYNYTIITNGNFSQKMFIFVQKKRRVNKFYDHQIK